MAKSVKVDGEAMTEEEFEHRLNVAHWGGRVDALEVVVRGAEAKSGDLFAARKDDLARLWREFADWLKSHHKNDARTWQDLKNRADDDECK